MPRQTVGPYRSHYTNLLTQSQNRAKAKLRRKKRKFDTLGKTSKKSYKYSVGPVAKHIPFMYMLGAKGTPLRQRNAIIDHMSGEQMNGVRRVMNDFISARIPTDKRIVNRLKKQKKLIYGLASNAVPSQTKKKILKQQGGLFFGALAPLLAPLAMQVAKPILEPVLKGTIGAITGGLRR